MTTLGQFLAPWPPIGAAMMFPDRGSLITLADGTVWLRTGAVAAASSYPKAAGLAHMGAHLFTGVGSTGASMGAIASNGAGTVIATIYANTLYYLYSTNYGATWSQQLHGLAGVLLTGVKYINGRFYLWYNDASTAYVTSSATGAPGTWVQNNVTLSGVAVGSTARLVYSGTQLVLAAKGETVVYTTPDYSTAWTTRTLTGYDTTKQPTMAATGAKIVVGYSGPPNACCSTDSGASWASVALPANGLNTAFSAGGTLGFVNINAATLAYYTASSDLLTWTQRTLPFPSSGYIAGATFQTDTYFGGALYNGLAIAYTTDGINWTQQSTSIDLSTSASSFMWMSNDALYGIQGAALQTVNRAASTIAAPNAVGNALAVQTATTASLSIPVLYYRVQ